MNNENLENDVKVQNQQVQNDDPFKNLVLKNDVKMPPRKTIRQELMKVSNFTEEELSIMYWSSLYKAYSLIVRYEQKNVEDYFRAQPWFQEAIKELRNKGKKNNSFDYTQFQRMKKENEKTRKGDISKVTSKSRTEVKKSKSDNNEKPTKEEIKKLKQNLKVVKKKVKTGELSITLVNKIICNILNNVHINDAIFSN
ncbi:MAG TPA: hypothetical protein PLD27_01290 [bacterium]|nr:hypothetical protein [bacterium]HOL46654.1 hypothetical protein [bacterium]HPQ17775.1 hypothetical protein [bacterium]